MGDNQQIKAVVSIDSAHGLALRADSLVGRITNLFDQEGNATLERNEAVSAVVEWPDFTWSAVDLRMFHKATLH